MNPSYSSGSSDSSVNTPGVKPGVIASGPDPADVPAPQPLSTPSPAMTPRKKLRLPTGGRSGSIPTIGGSSRGGSKKGLIIGALVAIVILIVVLVVVLLMGGGKGGNNKTRTDISFNDLINYITSGKESKSDVNDEYSITGSYYFVNGWSTEEEKSTIYAKTKELMDGFTASYKDCDNQILNNLVKSTKDLFDFIYAMNSKEKIYGIEATMTIVKEGDEKGKQKLVNHFAFSGLDDNSYAKSFSELYNDYIDALVNKVKVYKDNGCISGNYIDDECIKGKTSETFEDVNKYYLDTVHYYNLSENFVGNVYNINNLMHGKTLMGEENNEE